jgi:hypothetical protein
MTQSTPVVAIIAIRIFSEFTNSLIFPKDIHRYASSLLADSTPIAEQRALREGGEALGGVYTDRIADEVLLDGKANIHRQDLEDKYDECPIRVPDEEQVLRSADDRHPGNLGEDGQLDDQRPREFKVDGGFEESQSPELV